MRVDFYQLDGGATGVLVALATKLMGAGERLIVVHDDPAELAGLDRKLWTEAPADSFLAHGVVDEGRDKDQPILLTGRTVAPNSARNIVIADGQWRGAALDYDRAFYLFDEDTIAGARAAWKELAGAEGVERHYWAREEGRWVQKA
ncbi:DNA polymerase III subunit chi [Sphingomicrobium aestuariivivum]|uniref:DNA polymerase III subunit chi n=1 Tax=Sphingomicrobium aestuariivivum TaxID=1582356 RepID=UPI001FD6D2A6|nr:DNA polymerase III subunit chi [Sphingomicrobium aestuariivivum]MCJ8190034.1 DNA polymerase III subunit chi [Sphingomicrobium aestuariivivum]